MLSQSLYHKPSLSIPALGFAQICSWGSLYYSFPQIAQAVMQDFGWHKTELYGALTLALLLSASASLPAGVLVDKGHGRAVMTAGSIAAGLILLAGSQLTTLPAFYLVFAGIGFLHAFTLYEAVFAIVAQNASGAEAKQAITRLSLWGGFAATVFIPLNEFVLQQYDWRLLMRCLGLINLLICAAIYFQLPQRQTKLETQLQPKTQAQTKAHKGLYWALTQPLFWLLLICFAVFTTASTAFKFHLYPLLVEKDIELSQVVFLVAVLGPAQVLGRFLLALFADRTTAIRLAIATALALPIAFLAVLYLPANVWFLTPFLVLFGAATGTMTIVKATAVPELLSKQAYGAINGAMNLPIKLLKAFSPAIAAALWALGNSYDALLLTLVILGFIAALCFALASSFSPKHNAR